MFVTCYLLMLGASGGQMSVQVDSYEEDATLPAMKLSLNKKIGLLILEQYLRLIAPFSYLNQY